MCSQTSNDWIPAKEEIPGELLGAILRSRHKSEQSFAAAQVEPPVGKCCRGAQGQSGLSSAGASGPPGSPKRPQDSGDVRPRSNTLKGKDMVFVISRGDDIR